MNKKIDCNRTINQKEKEDILKILYNSISKKINLNTNKKNKIFNRKEYDEIINKKINNFNEYKNPEYLNVK